MSFGQRLERWPGLARCGALALLLNACGALVQEPPASQEPIVQGPPSPPADRSASPEALVGQLRARLSLPDGELRVQTRVDGTRRVALDGHLQHATIAVVDAEGVIRTTCVDSPPAAARAIGLQSPPAPEVAP